MSIHASCRRRVHCAEVRSVAAAPLRLLGPRFRGGNEGGSDLAPIYLIVFPAKAGTQGPRSTGWQPEGHRATTASAARRVLFFLGEEGRALLGRAGQIAHNAPSQDACPVTLLVAGEPS